MPRKRTTTTKAKGSTSSRRTRSSVQDEAEEQKAEETNPTNKQLDKEEATEEKNESFKKQDKSKEDANQKESSELNNKTTNTIESSKSATKTIAQKKSQEVEEASEEEASKEVASEEEASEEEEKEEEVLQNKASSKITTVVSSNSSASPPSPSITPVKMNKTMKPSVENKATPVKKRKFEESTSAVTKINTPKSDDEQLKKRGEEASDNIRNQVTSISEDDMQVDSDIQDAPSSKIESSNTQMDQVSNIESTKKPPSSKNIKEKSNKNQEEEEEFEVSTSIPKYWLEEAVEAQEDDKIDKHCQRAIEIASKLENGNCIAVLGHNEETHDQELWVAFLKAKPRQPIKDTSTMRVSWFHPAGDEYYYELDTKTIDSISVATLLGTVTLSFKANSPIVYLNPNNKMNKEIIQYWQEYSAFRKETGYISDPNELPGKKSPKKRQTMNSKRAIIKKESKEEENDDDVEIVEKKEVKAKPIKYWQPTERFKIVVFGALWEALHSVCKPFPKVFGYKMLFYYLSLWDRYLNKCLEEEADCSLLCDDSDIFFRPEIITIVGKGKLGELSYKELGNIFNESSSTVQTHIPTLEGYKLIKRTSAGRTAIPNYQLVLPLPRSLSI